VTVAGTGLPAMEVAMRQRQRGVTFLGWLVLLVPVAIVGYMVIRVTPAYLTYSKVVRDMEQVKAEFASSEGITRQALVNSLDKRFDIDYIDDPKPKDFTITKGGDGWVMQASYETVVPLFYNASLLLQFDKSVTIP
jgi:hypothetical protein